MSSTRNKRKANENNNNNETAFKNPRCITNELPAAGLSLSSEQIRQLWLYDNECGSLHMKGCPLRICKMQDIPCPGTVTDDAGITEEQMILLKDSIKDMWMKAANIFEVFFDSDEEEKGFRLRVRKDIAMKVTIRQQDAVPMGWIARIPEVDSSCHVYKRSPVEPRGYLGGPISYVNWWPSSKQNVVFLQSTSKSYISNMYTKGTLRAGIELMWDYGSKRYLPQCGDWFNNECCQVFNATAADLRRHSEHDRLRSFVYREQCVLCGHSYSIENKESKINRKQHLAGKHADFLGSIWDGSGIYGQQVVDLELMLQKTDELNQLLSTLSKMRWNVLPACKVFSQSELDGGIFSDPEAVMDEFHRRQELLKKGGTLVLRGAEYPTLPSHFRSVQPSQWKILNWKDDKVPVNGRYAVPSHIKESHEAAVAKFVTNFCQKYLHL